MFLDICNDGDTLKIMRAIVIVYRIIRVLLPLLIIFLATFDLYKTVTEGTPDSLKKRALVVGRRVAIAIFIILIPTIFPPVYEMFFGKANFMLCFDNATVEGIQEAYYNSAVAALDELEQTADYNIRGKALKYINQITDAVKRKELQTRFDEIMVIVEEKNKAKVTEHHGREGGDGGGGGGGDTGRGTNPPQLGPELQAPPGETLKSYNAPTGRTINYFEIVPKNPKENMPLIVYLHGDGEVGDINSITYLPIYKYVKNTYDNEIPFVFIAPHTTVYDWISSPIPETVKSLTDHVVDEYKIDKNHVIIMGVSRGAIGAWNMVAKYGSFWSAAAPISCPAVTSNDPNSYKMVPIYAVSGDSGNQEAGYNSSMSDLVKRIQGVGGTAVKITYHGDSHNTISTKLANKDMFIWLLTH